VFVHEVAFKVFFEPVQIIYPKQRCYELDTIATDDNQYWIIRAILKVNSKDQG